MCCGLSVQGFGCEDSDELCLACWLDQGCIQPQTRKVLRKTSADEAQQARLVAIPFVLLVPRILFAACLVCICRRENRSLIFFTLLVLSE